MTRERARTRRPGSVPAERLDPTDAEIRIRQRASEIYAAQASDDFPGGKE